MSGSARSILVRLALGIVLLCVGAMGLVGCRPVCVPRVVKIGLVGSFEGLYRGTGYEMLFAVKLALAEWNARGGVGGHPVELVALDDSGSPEQARRQPRELASDPDVMGVVGHAQSTVTDAALSEYDAQGLPLVLPVSRMRDYRSGWVFSVAADYWQEVAAAMEQAGVPPGEIVVLLSDEDAWLASGVEALDAWEVAAWNGSRDGTAPLASAKGIVLAGTAVDAAEWAMSLTDMRGAVLAGGSELQADAFRALAGEHASGIWLGATAAAAPAEAWNRFRKDYVALAGSEPGLAGALAYDAANVLLAAMERAARSGELSRAGVADALRETDWNGLTGPIAFRSDGSRTSVQVAAHRLSLSGP